jgi:hypothetical protein
VSWNPFVKSNPRAIAMTTMRSRSLPMLRAVPDADGPTRG